MNECHKNIVWSVTAEEFASGEIIYFISCRCYAAQVKPKMVCFAGTNNF